MKWFMKWTAITTLILNVVVLGTLFPMGVFGRLSIWQVILYVSIGEIAGYIVVMLVVWKYFRTLGGN